MNFFRQKEWFWERSMMKNGNKGVSENNDEKIISGDGRTIGHNVRQLRKSRQIGQTELVARLQLSQVAITRETLVKIESGRQHIKLAQLRGIRDLLSVSYEELLDGPTE